MEVILVKRNKKCLTVSPEENGAQRKMTFCWQTVATFFIFPGIICQSQQPSWEHSKASTAPAHGFALG